MSFFNQYSYVIFSLIALVAVTLILRRYTANGRAAAAGVAALAVLVMAGYFLLRPGAGDVQNADAAYALIENSDKPTVLEFFSNYCAGCLAVRPLADQLAAEVADEFNFVRVDIHSDVGRVLRDRYQFSYTPEFIVFDATGRELWRAHVLPDVTALDLARTGS